MTATALTRAWIALLLLSGLATLVSAGVGAGLNRQIAGVAMLFLALVKARVILSRYLGLVQAPMWLRGFTISLTLFCLLLAGLYLVAPG